MSRKVVVVVGTRPEAIKLIPVYLELKTRVEFEVCLVSTGQHKQMLAQIFDFFEVTADIELEVMVPNQTLSGLSSKLFQSFQEVVETKSPNVVIVQGDTTTAMVCSLVAFYNKCRVAHVEAGLRTGDKYSPFPEEVNRSVIGQVADFHFTPTSLASKNLQQIGLDSIFQVGNTVVDALTHGLKLVYGNTDQYDSWIKEQIGLLPKKMILVTGHRRESFGQGFRDMCEALRQLSERYSDYEFVYPVHLNPKVQEPVNELLNELANFHLIAPVPYGEMIYLMDKASLIITDSGGIQEEAPTLNCPVVVTREVTERPEGVDAGCAVLAGTSVERIVGSVTSILDDDLVYQRMSQIENPYGKGDSSIQIADVLADAKL